MINLINYSAFTSSFQNLNTPIFKEKEVNHTCFSFNVDFDDIKLLTLFHVTDIKMLLWNHEILIIKLKSKLSMFPTKLKSKLSKSFLHNT